MKRILISLVVEGAFLGCLYAWKFRGIEGAGNVVACYLWVCAVLAGVLLIAALKGLTEAPPPVNRFGRFVGRFADLVAAVVLVWFGHFVLAALVGFARFRVWAYRHEADKKAAERKSA
jgi:hypothetical protein